MNRRQPVNTAPMRWHRLGALSALLAALWLPVAQAVVPASAEIVSITGRAEARNNASAPWNAAQPKQVLVGGNFVRTLDDSSLALLFADKTQLRLSRNSMFEIKGVGDGKTSDTTLSLIKGKSWAQSKSVPDKLRIETPSGAAGIHGTDWVLEVDDDGLTTLTVLSGEVEFSNAQGSVRVGPNEQSVTAVGAAPQKRLLQNPRDRVQWVTAFRADPARYPELAQQPELTELRWALAAGQTGAARTALERWLDAPSAAATGPASPAGAAAAPRLAAAWLLAAELALAAGETEVAAQRLASAAAHYPNDDRIAAAQVRLALFGGDWAQARSQLQAAQGRFKDSFELLLLGAELARLDGDGARAAADFGQASARAPDDMRGWHGLGVTLAEQENFAPARAALQRAVALAPNAAATLADLAALETSAKRWPQANAAIEQALALQGDDYVAWTSLGILRLNEGQPEAALEAFLKAGVLEPRYARTQLHAGIAWYQLGRPDAALSALERAKALDPNDPLPYLYEAQIRRDALDPMAAVTAARAAQQRFPYLKSLGPIASDRQGSANLGAAYALFGLESWARRMAVQTQHPFMAASHLFLADRSSEPWIKNSGLVQGYLTDPTLFGASPQRSTLMAVPGTWLAAELGATHNDAVSSVTPSLIANGYRSAPVPMAAFVQTDAPRFRSGDMVFEARAPSLTAAFGIQPHEQWSLFFYRDEFRPRIERVAMDTDSDRIRGQVTRSDAGLRWQIDPQTALWFSAGETRESTDVTSLVKSQTRDYQRSDSGQGLRLTARRDSGEWTLGLEGGKTARPGSGQRLGAVNRIESQSYTGSSGERLYLSWRGGSQTLRWQADWDNSRFRIEDTAEDRVTSVASGKTTLLINDPARLQRSTQSLRLGAAWSPQPGTTYRLVWQDLVRPAPAVSLGPLDTVGIGLDVPGLQPGGRLKRWRAQGEWELAANSYLMAFADRRDIRNLIGPDGQTLNPVASLAQYERLRQQGLASARAPEALEASPFFGDGVVQTQGLVFEQIAAPQWAWQASLIHASADNRAYPGAALPYLPRYTLGLGLTWFAPERWVIQANASRRTGRYSDDQSLTKESSAYLAADWDVALRATWQDPAKRYLFELYARGLARKDDSASVGLRAVWRY